MNVWDVHTHTHTLSSKERLSDAEEPDHTRKSFCTSTEIASFFLRVFLSCLSVQFKYKYT